MSFMSYIEKGNNIRSKFSKEVSKIADVLTDKLIHTLSSDHKILIAGNGGSAADSQHFAAELVVKFTTLRKALNVEALTTDTSIITAIANDFSFDYVFARQIEAKGKEGDIFIGISTSGNSENIIEAFKIAKEKSIYTILIGGKDGGIAKQYADLSLIVPSNTTSFIQEAHESLFHWICYIIDERFKSYNGGG